VNRNLVILSPIFVVAYPKYPANHTWQLNITPFVVDFPMKKQQFLGISTEKGALFMDFFMDFFGEMGPKIAQIVLGDGFQDPPPSPRTGHR
jgi:hypothetical protein